jgi:hypothetical protein
MRLSELSDTEVQRNLDQLLVALADRSPAAAVLARIRSAANSSDLISSDALVASAVGFCQSWQLPLIEVAPSTYFSWDGRALASDIEPTVLIHEVAHFQVCAPDRRHLIDFGLGAGPETGRKSEADSDQRLFGVEADLEEALASMLGILWEIDLQHPALDAFLEQNWLEGGDRPENVAHFEKICGRLLELGLIDAFGQPQRIIRSAADDQFYVSLLA